ncbi:hypothetical protein KEM52_005318 [Ascosphaera acerosa]|nr:hypothetical protein KEM52_005318 [Ascosphaera acerosa]
MPVPSQRQRATKGGDKVFSGHPLTSDPGYRSSGSPYTAFAAHEYLRTVSWPHSALTDFLAANNISAAEIRATYESRRRLIEEANAAAAADAATASEPSSPHNGSRTGSTATPAPGGAQADDNDDEDDAAVETAVSSPAAARRRRAAVAAAIKRKRQMRNLGLSDDDDDGDSGDGGNGSPSALPRKLVHCDECGTRFMTNTLTRRLWKDAVLCAVCSSSGAGAGVGTSRGPSPQAKTQHSRTGAPKRKRREFNSRLMDGGGPHGASSLLEICIKLVADNIHDIEEFGDIPSGLRLRLGQILSKRRAINTRTLQLFLGADVTDLDLYDCADLNGPDFRNIFLSAPNLQHLNLRFAGQLKNDEIDLLINRNLPLQQIQLDACNLVRTETFVRLFACLGTRLQSLKLSNLDGSLDDDSVRQLVASCPNLRRLEFSDCWLLGDGTVEAVRQLRSLKHLSLYLERETSPTTLAETIAQIGPSLETLALKGPGTGLADDTVLAAVRAHCTSLSKFRLTDNSTCTDRGFASLFRVDWPNPPLRVVDLSRTRSLDNANPDGPADEPLGLASAGFRALMAHSGARLEVLHISACRHIAHSAFLAVFDGEKEYPCLRELDISFQPVVDDLVLQRIFASCPRLRKVVAFACFNVRMAEIPPGVSYFGGLNAHRYALESGSAAL